MNQAYPALGATLAVQIMMSMAALAAPVLAPLAALDFGLDAHLVGVFFALQYAFASVAGLISGGFSGRYGGIRVSQACLVFAALAMAIAASGFPLFLLVGACMMGLGYGPATPASSELLARVAPARSFNLVFSIKQTGVPLGNMLAGAILPSLALALGWRGAAMATGLVCLVLAVTLQALRPALDSDRDPRRPLRMGGFIEAFKTVWRLTGLRVLSFTSITYSCMQASLAAFLVTYLHTELAMPLVVAGLALAAAQIGGAAGRILWGVVADRTRRPILVMGGLGLAMTACAGLVGLFTTAWSYLGLLAVCVCFGATAVAWNGVYLAEVARLSPHGMVGAITGVSAFLAYVGVALGPALFTVILSVTDQYAHGFWLMAAMTLLSGLVFVGWGLGRRDGSA